MKRQQKKWLLMAVGLGSVLWGKTSWASSTADATITITPVASVSLAISATTYAFGNLDVNISSASGTSLTLSNNGQVNVSVTKQITNQSNPAGWTAGTVPGLDTYALFVATSTAQPSVGDFNPGEHMFGALNNSTNLQGLGGGTPIVTTASGGLSSVALWFRLDTPTSVSSQAAREITVTFTGTAN